MSHAFLFGFQVTQVVLVRCSLDGYVLDYLQPVALQSYALDGVVGHEAHLLYT